MKKYILFIAAIAGMFHADSLQAGNPDRAGGAGGTQLLLNPYGRSAGMMGANTAYLRGVEAMHFNVGGLAYLERTELQASRVVYLQGTDIFYNNFSFGQNFGNGNVLGLSFTAMDFGDIRIRTESQPDGTLGTFSPQVINIGLAYSKKFSNSISGGLLVRYVYEGINNASATGIGLDAGVQYQTSLNPKKKIKKEDFRFGIGVRNIGPNMVYGGSGLTFRSINPATGADRRAAMGSEQFNLPALVNIGASYDMRLDKSADTYFHRLTASGNFNYNAFSSNIIAIGAEYSFKETFMLRAGYGWQENQHTVDDFRHQTYGYSGGCTIQLPISKSGTMLGIDYAYQPTRTFNGVHNLSLRFTIGNKKS
jgi:hypothetical protein